MSGLDIDPKFYALLRRSDEILATLRQLQSDPTNTDWVEVRKYSKELANIAYQMEELLPTSKQSTEAEKNTQVSAIATIYLDDGRICYRT